MKNIIFWLYPQLAKPLDELNTKEAALLRQILGITVLVVYVLFASILALILI